MLLHVTMAPIEDGWIVIECPALPGCVSQGKDEEDALANIKEAMTGWLQVQNQKTITSLSPGETLMTIDI